MELAARGLARHGGFEPESDLSGRQISRYQVIEKLGEGGMGQLYRAKDTNLCRHVAINVLPDEFSHNPERLARFQREAQVLASLGHPNVATLYGLEESDGKRLVVMELVEGQTLAERLLMGPRRSTRRWMFAARLPRDWRPHTRRGRSTAICTRQTSC